MYNSTERISKIYKVTSEYGNIQTKKTITYKTVVKKVLNFIELDVTQFAKTTQLLLVKKANNCTWTGNLYYFYE